MKKPSEFQEKLLLSVIDKVVFGLLIVLAGFVLNRALEDYRSEQATQAEIARLRVARVSTVWTELNKQQAQIDRIAPAVAFDAKLYFRSFTEGYHFTRTESDKMLRLSRNRRDADASFARREPSVVRLLRDNRFWIGEQLYPRYAAYADRQRALVRAYTGVTSNLSIVRPNEPIRNREAFKRALERAQQRRQELLEARSDVVDVMSELS